MDNKLNASNRGFSLMELVLVVFAIGVLALIAIPYFSSVVRDAEVARILQVHETVSIAVRNFYSDTGVLPATILDLWQNNTSSPIAGWAGPYVDQPLTASQSPFGSLDLDRNCFAWDTDANGTKMVIAANRVALAFAAVPQDVAMEVDKVIDKGVPTSPVSWEVGGKVMWDPPTGCFGITADSLWILTYVPNGDDIE